MHIKMTCNCNTTLGENIKNFSQISFFLYALVPWPIAIRMQERMYLKLGWGVIVGTESPTMPLPSILSTPLGSKRGLRRSNTEGLQREAIKWDSISQIHNGRNTGSSTLYVLSIRVKYSNLWQFILSLHTESLVSLSFQTNNNTLAWIPFMYNFSHFLLISTLKWNEPEVGFHIFIIIYTCKSWHLKSVASVHIQVPWQEHYPPIQIAQKCQSLVTSY